MDRPRHAEPLKHAGAEWTIRRIAPADARPLRRRILRPHQDPGASVYAGDDADTSFHVGVLDNDVLVGVASMYAETLEGRPDGTGWRIRGMATEPAHRGRGVGLALADACVERALRHGGTHLWCNARLTAAPFYTKCGFRSVGDAFELEGIGPHVVMVRELEVPGA